VFSRAQILEKVWNSSAEWQQVSTVTEHVRKLRLKIEADATNPRWIQTIRNIGYRFDP
jgi:two-component system alkaline phosphatase synthesis response regulator PhoP